MAIQSNKKKANWTTVFSRIKDTVVSRDLVNADMLSQQISLVEDVLKGCK